MRILATGAALLAMAATGLAETLKVPQQFETIQAAADAAQDGDTIKIAPGVYNEAVVIGEKSNVKFVGSKGTIWESHVEGYTTCLTVYGNGFVIQGIRFRHAYRAIYLSGTGNTVQKCSFLNTWEDTVRSYGDGFVFAKNAVTGCYRGVDASEGIDAVVERNTFRRIYDRHVVVDGAGAAVRGNVLSGAYGESDVVSVNGASAEVSGNRIRNAYGTQVSVSSNGAVISGNTLGNGYAGIYFSGTSGTIEGNRISTTYYYGINVSGGFNAVRGNDVGISYYSALNLNGDSNEITGNRCHDVTDDRGIYVSGSGTIIDGNTISNTLSYGIQASGSNITVRGNRVQEVWDNAGIYVSSGSTHTVEDNVVVDCVGGGITVSGDLGTISGNTVSGSGTYYYNGIAVYGNQHVIEGNRVSAASNAGIYINGNANDLVGCDVTGSDINGISIGGDANTLDGCSATGCEGQGFLNGGTNTTVTGSTFLKNGLDVANSGTLVGGTTGMTFETGGEGQAPVYFSYP